MADLSILAGATSQSVNVFIQDTRVGTGAGLTGLVFNTAGLTAYYSFSGAVATATSITLNTLALITTAYSSGGFKEIDATNMPGWYRLDLPNAALATAKGRQVSLHLQGAANMAPCVLKIELTGWDNQDAVHGGLSCLPNTAVTTNASLLTSGVGTDQISVSAGKLLLQATQAGVTIPTVTTVTNQLTAAQIATGVWQDATAGDFTTASSIGKALYIANIAPGAAGGHFIAGSNAATTVNFTGNLSGSVGSLTTNNDKTGYTLSAAGVQAVWDALTSALTTVGSIGKLIVTNLDALISSRMATYTQPTGFLAATFPGTVASPTNITAASGVALTAAYDLAKTAAQAGDAMTLTAAYDAAKTAASATTAAAIKTQTDKMTFTVANQIDANVLDWKSATAPAMTGDAYARLGAPVGASVSADVAAVKTDTAAIKTKTDSLTFTVAGQVDANAESMNATTILGTGTSGDLWRG
jgi:hypothetical protein